VAYIGAELGEALDYVHRSTSPEGLPLNLVHRDVNPPNILLSHIGEVKLGDFGVARAAIHVRLTQADRVCGKLGYLAPEQARGQRLRAQLCALTGELAPYPNGQRELARLVQEAMMRQGNRPTARDSEQGTRPAHPPVQPQSEEPTAVLPRA
jgi:serine/threonine-protein kinase